MHHHVLAFGFRANTHTWNVASCKTRSLCSLFTGKRMVWQKSVNNAHSCSTQNVLLSLWHLVLRWLCGLCITSVSLTWLCDPVIENTVILMTITISNLLQCTRHLETSVEIRFLPKEIAGWTIPIEVGYAMRQRANWALQFTMYLVSDGYCVDFVMSVSLQLTVRRSKALPL